mgnify:CR=1 FL=1
MKYGFTVEMIESEGRKYWVAKSKDLEYCVGQGDTCDEAVKELEQNELVWLEMAQEDGENIPEPSVNHVLTFSGKFTVRLSKSLHERAAKRAEQEGVSLNAFIAEAVAEKTVGIPNNYMEEFFNIVNRFGKVVDNTGGLITSMQGIVRDSIQSWKPQYISERIQVVGGLYDVN